MKMRQCKKCRRWKVVGEGIGSRGIPTCVQCKTRHEAGRSQARKDPRPTEAVEGRECSRCGEIRVVGTEISPRGKICFACQREHQIAEQRKRYERNRQDPAWVEETRARNRASYEKTKADPERWAKLSAYRDAYRKEHAAEMRQYRETYRKRNPDRSREHDRDRMRRRMKDPKFVARAREVKRRSYWKIRTDPERWARKLEDQRMWYRLRHNSPPVSTADWEIRNGHAGAGRYVPADRLEPLLREYIGPEEERVNRNGRDGNRPFASLADIADLAGVSERRIWGVLHKENPHVTVDTADKILAAIGVPFSMVYPDHR